MIMKCSSFSPSCAIWLAATIVLAQPASAQQKYSLVEIDAVGDVCTLNTTYKMAMTAKRPDAKNGGSEQTHYSNTMHRTYTATILAADHKGEATIVRRKYTAYQSVQDGPGGNEVLRHSLDGKTVVLKRQGDKAIISVEKGVISAEDRADLVDVFSHSVSYVPKQPISVGEAWDVDAAGLRRAFGLEKGTASLQGVAAELVSFAGHPCIRIHYVGDFGGVLKDGKLNTHITLEGDGFYALDLKRLLATKLKGPITMHSTADDAGPSVEGTITADETYDWLQVAGKPVSKVSTKR